jgi:hypothetical protein
MNAATKAVTLGVTEEQRHACESIVDCFSEDDAVDSLKEYFEGWMAEYTLPPILADWMRQSFDQVDWRELVRFFKG